jgi:hypothetical protein
MAQLVSVVAQTEVFTVLDDVLDAGECDRLWNFFQTQRFARIDATEAFFGHWALDDGGALRGPTVGFGHKWDAVYPTGTALDDVMKAVVECAELFEPTIGARGTDWDVFSAFPTLYAAGQGLLWHRDAADNAGSWVYYGHPRWNVEWGGELLLAERADFPAEYGVYLHRLRVTPETPAGPPGLAHIDNDDANELLMEQGFGSFVMPKPNRMVIIKGGTPHAIAKVRAAAGRIVRASVGGFFKRKNVNLAGPTSPIPI